MYASPGSAPAPEPKVSPGPAIVPPKPGVQRPSRKGLWGGVLIALVLVGGYAVWNRQQKQNKVADSGGPTISVPTVVVSLGGINSTVRVNGTIAAEKSAALLAPRIMGSRGDFNRGGDGLGRGGGGGGGGMAGGGGPGGGFGGDFQLVLLHLAKPGVRVKAGEVVAEFDPTNQLLRLDDYKDSVVQLDNTVRKMMATLAATKEMHDQQVRTSKADWDKAVLDLKTAEIRSQIDAEKYKLAVEEAEIKYKELLRQSALVDESQVAAIRSSELNRDQSKIELSRAEMNVQRMTIKAPMDGIVVMGNLTLNGELRQIREGDQISAGQPFMYIVDPRSMVLNATVNQVDAERLRLGMKALIKLDAYPDVDLPGTLIGVGAMSKTSTFRASYVGEIPVRMKIERMDPRVIPDLTGSAEVIMNSETDTLVAPRNAVFDEDGGKFVYVQGQEGNWVRKKVDLGLASFTHVAIRSGLQKGDVIAAQRPL